MNSLTDEVLQIFLFVDNIVLNRSNSKTLESLLNEIHNYSMSSALDKYDYEIYLGKHTGKYIKGHSGAKNNLKSKEW